MPSVSKLRPAAATVVAFLFAAGCELFTDLDKLESRQCPEGQKACGNTCERKDNPNVGCSRDSCAPCALPHAQASCNNGLCFIEVGACLGDWEDCDGNVSNGCETDLAHDPMNCNRCFRECAKPSNGIAGCSMRECTIGGCNPGWEDCDEKPATGCEHPIWTDQECLTCKLPCAEGTHCMQGVCM